MALSPMRQGVCRLLSRQIASSGVRRACNPFQGVVTTAVPSPVRTQFHRTISDGADKKSCQGCVNNMQCKKHLATQASKPNAEGATQSAPPVDEISTAVRNDERGWFEVSWKDGYLGKYPYVWMRDNCRCSECFYPSCHSRSMLMVNLDVDVKPLSQELKDDGNALEICWSDGHTSSFPSDWLKLHRFDKTDFDPIKKIHTVSWGSEFTENIPTFRFEDFLTNRQDLSDYLECLVKYGLVKIKDAPHEKGVIRTICDRIGYPRITCYGPDFRVESLFDSSSLAFTSIELGLHVDLPFYGFRPGAQLLHCIRQCETKGGESQFVDAKHVVEKLRREDPELFEQMTKTRLDFRLLGEDFVGFHLQHDQPMIELDEDGEFKMLAYNDQVRAPYLNVPVEEVGQVYRALKKLHQAMYCRENFIDIKLEEGDVIAFDNNRVLHGRSAYTVSMGKDGKKKSRLLEGGFLDWDEIYSRMRLLDEQINGTPRL